MIKQVTMRVFRVASSIFVACCIGGFVGVVHAAEPMPVQQIGYQLVATFPHSPDIFTQGLELLDKGRLIESSGHYGKSGLRIFELESGELIHQHKLPDHLFGEGVTVWDNLAYQLTWRAGKVRIYDARTLQLQKSWSYSGQGWGLTHDKTHFIMSDGTADLTFRSTQDFSERRRVTVTLNGKPHTHLNELEWIDGVIFANVWLQDYIVAINPADGVVIAQIDIASLRKGQGGVANGIAWDAAKRNMLVTGKYWQKIFALKLDTFPAATAKLRR